MTAQSPDIGDGSIGDAAGGQPVDATCRNSWNCTRTEDNKKINKQMKWWIPYMLEISVVLSTLKETPFHNNHSKFWSLVNGAPLPRQDVSGKGRLKCLPLDEEVDPSFKVYHLFRVVFIHMGKL
jgi:hypothetical protein